MAMMVPEGALKDAPADADVVPYDGQTVVLDDLVRDEILLEIPMIPLCSADCPGMQSASLNKSPAPPSVDPRLEPLRRLKLPKE